MQKFNQPTKEDQRKAQIFLKHIPTQQFCACFADDQAYSDFLRGKDEETRRNYWPYKREHLKRYIGLHPDHIVINTKHA
jgi:hypothetical protein